MWQVYLFFFFNLILFSHRCRSTRGWTSLHKEQKYRFLRHWGRKIVHGFIKWPCYLETRTLTSNLWPQSHTPLLSECFRRWKFVGGCCLLTLPAPSSLPENRTESLCWCLLHILCFFKLLDSLSFFFHLLSPIQHCRSYSEVALCCTLVLLLDHCC